MTTCLEGVRVLELARFQAGPRAGLVLSDLGAEVIKIEKPGGEDTRKTGPLVRGQSMYFAAYNRGKKSVVIDMRKPEGIELFKELVAHSDIVLENFRPGMMDSIGLGYEALCEIKRDIVLVSVSAFGQYGPHRDKTGLDNLGQALSGLMDLTGQVAGGDRPVMTAFSLVDRTTALHATIGALGALRHRDLTGEGQVIDVCLMDSAYSMVEIPGSYYLATGEEGGEGQGNRPLFQARDGWVTVSSATTVLVDRLADAIGLAPADAAERNPLGDTNKRASPERLEAVRAPFRKWCLERTVDEVVATLEQAGVMVAPVRAIPAAMEDPHVAEREVMVKVPDPLAGEIYAPGLSIKFSKTPGKLGSVAVPGEHTDDILRTVLDCDEERIAALKASGVVRGPDPVHAPA